MARMVVVYKRPKDVEAFERHYFEKHVPLAKQLPGIRKYEVSRGPIVSPTGAADRHELAPDPSMFQMFLFDHKEV